MSLRVIVIVLVAGTWTHEFMEMENKVRITSMLGELCPHVETCRNNASGLVRPSTCCTGNCFYSLAMIFRRNGFCQPVKHVYMFRTEKFKGYI